MEYRYLLRTKENENFEYEVYEITCKEDLPETKVLDLCNRIYSQHHFIECKQITENRHICGYCGWVVEGKDEDVLCSECRITFGHAFYSEL